MSVQTINEKIELINTYKNNIKNAIKAKGVNVADTDKLEVYASKIALIEQNSGGESSGGYTLEDMLNRRFPSVVSSDASYISAYTFYAAKVVDVNFPKAWSMGTAAFANCASLERVSLQNTSIVSNSCFYYCSRLSDAYLPNVKNIGSYAFAHCRRLSEITLPMCMSISFQAFGSCYNLLSVTLGGSSVCYITNSSVFSNTPIRGTWNSSYASSINGIYGSIYVPMSLVDAYKVSTNWTYFSSRIVGY